jgi:hypothetical protein
MAKEVIAGIAGGIAAAGLMRITAPPTSISSNKETIPRQTLPSAGSATLKPTTTYKFAIVLFHGDGDPQVRLDITKGATTVSINGNEQAIEILANESILIAAVNTDIINPRSTSTIEIISLDWS